MSDRISPDAGQLVELARQQMGLTLTERLQVALRERWPACRGALGVAAQVGARAVLIGPVAAALRGAPGDLCSSRVDLLVTHSQLAEVSAWLTRARAFPAGLERSGSQVRQLWRRGQSDLTVLAAGGDDRRLRGAAARAQPVTVDLMARGCGIVRLARAEDLLAIAVASPWGEDSADIPALMAVRSALDESHPEQQRSGGHLRLV